jgi:hypothetical protein
MTYRIPAYRIQLVRDGSGRARRRRCQTAAQAVEIFRDYVGDANLFQEAPVGDIGGGAHDSGEPAPGIHHGRVGDVG